MNRKLFEGINKAVCAFGEAQGKFSSSRRNLWGEILPLVVRVVKNESRRPQYKLGVPHSVLRNGVSECIRAAYRSKEFKNKILPGRRVADGVIILAVNNQIIDEAIKWARICEAIIIARSPKQYLCGPEAEKFSWLNI